MTINELKIDLIKRIIACNDIELLLKAQALLSQFYSENPEEQQNYMDEPNAEYDHLTTENIRVFSKEEQLKINRALNQYKNGECISDEEAQKEIQEWLED